MPKAAGEHSRSDSPLPSQQSSPARTRRGSGDRTRIISTISRLLKREAYELGRRDAVADLKQIMERRERSQRGRNPEEEQRRLDEMCSCIFAGQQTWSINCQNPTHSRLAAAGGQTQPECQHLNSVAGVCLGCGLSIKVTQG